MNNDSSAERFSIERLLKIVSLAVSLALLLTGSMNTLPRNMPLPAFDPHMKTWACRYEKSTEPELDRDAEQWFREGLALTSFDLWPDDRQFSKAAALWTTAAEKGHWKAMLNLASLYINGTGVEQDTEHAVQLVERAMRMGVPKAFDLMGTYHLNGTGVEQDATRAYAFWIRAAEMGNADAQAYLGEKLTAAYDDPRGEFWANPVIGSKMLECSYAQENGNGAAELGLSISRPEEQERSLRAYHDGVKFGSEVSANHLAVAFRGGFQSGGQGPDTDRADRYSAISHMLHLNPDLRLPNLDKVLPLPPAVLPYWDGDKQSLIDGAKPVKAVVPGNRNPSPGSLRQGRAHIPDGFTLPEELPDGYLIQHGNTNASLSGYWIAQLRDPQEPRLIAWNAAQLPMRYEAGERFEPSRNGLGSNDGIVRFHYLGIPVPQDSTARYVPDWRVPQGILREVPVPSRDLRSAGLLPAPATGIWHGRIDPSHPLTKVFNQWTRQSYVEEGQPFPDPRDRGLDISPKDIEWQWLDQANQPLPSGRKEITIRNFSSAKDGQM